jgi:hypothetical protein
VIPIVFIMAPDPVDTDLVASLAHPGGRKPVKRVTPICLTFHPPNPPTPDEVIVLAKLSATKLRSPLV